MAPLRCCLWIEWLAKEVRTPCGEIYWKCWKGLEADERSVQSWNAPAAGYFRRWSTWSVSWETRGTVTYRKGLKCAISVPRTPAENKKAGAQVQPQRSAFGAFFGSCPYAPAAPATRTGAWQRFQTRFIPKKTCYITITVRSLPLV